MIMLKLNTDEAMAVCDALIDAAIDLRTNPMTGVVVSEGDFLATNISERRRSRYLFLMETARSLRRGLRALSLVAPEQSWVSERMGEENLERRE